MSGLGTAQELPADLGAQPPPPRLASSLVDDPLRLNRELLVAASTRSRGSRARRAEVGPAAIDRADAAVVSARCCSSGRTRSTHQAQGPSPRPVVVIAENGPVTRAATARLRGGVPRHAALEVIVDCLLSPGPGHVEPPRRELAGQGADASLTRPERQVLGLLASGLTPPRWPGAWRSPPTRRVTTSRPSGRSSTGRRSWPRCWKRSAGAVLQVDQADARRPLRLGSAPGLPSSAGSGRVGRGARGLPGMLPPEPGGPG